MKIILFLFSALIASSLHAQFTMSGEFRPRSEYRHGFSTLANLDQDPAFFTDQRSRLNFMFNDDTYELKIVVQDVRTWGSQSQLVANDGNLTTLHEAWGRLKLNESVSLKLGRQEIVLDDSRMFGNVDWAQQARSHDAAMLDWEKEGMKMKFAVAYNQDGPQTTTNYYTVPNSYKAFQMVWMQKNFTSFNASLLLLNQGMQTGVAPNGATRFSQTIGGRVDKSSGSLKPGGSIYYQTGRDGNAVELAALQYQLDVKYALSESTQITVGYEHLSGNDQVNPNSKNNSFTPFYGTNHKFNGLMDYFYVGNHIGSVGLNDLFFQGEFKLEKNKLQADFHIFSTDGRLLDPATSNAANKYLGSEFDFVFTRKVSEVISWNVGYSHMLATESMEILKGGNADATNNWGWVMLTIKPTFFTMEKVSANN